MKRYAVVDKSFTDAQLLRLVRKGIKDRGIALETRTPVSKSVLVRLLKEDGVDFGPVSKNDYLVKYAESLVTAGVTVPDSKRVAERRVIRKSLKSAGKRYQSVNKILHQTSPVEVVESQLKALGLTYIREHPLVVSTGKGVDNQKLYLLDFYLPDRKLALEIDGGYHNTSDQRKADNARDLLVRRHWNIRTLRIPNEVALVEGFDISDYL